MENYSARSWKEVQYSIALMSTYLLLITVILNEMPILPTLITWEFWTYKVEFRLIDKHILLSAQSLSVALESNLNCLFHFSPTFINAWSILSL